MAVYRCNSCGATTDTEATARALRESLGYGPGTQIGLTAPQKCDVCGSTDIAEVTAESPVAAPRAEKPRICKKCGTEFRGVSLFCDGCGEFDRGEFMTMLWVVALGGGLCGLFLWYTLTNGFGTNRPQWFCAAFPLFFLVVILVNLVRTARDSARALRSARKGSSQT